MEGFFCAEVLLESASGLIVEGMFFPRPAHADILLIHSPGLNIASSACRVLCTRVQRHLLF